jgi:hypothetical protein
MTQTTEEPAPSPLVMEDPLNSPHPIPWSWITETHAMLNQLGTREVRHYRSLSILSPDGQYAAYSRIQMTSQPEFSGCLVTSTMFLEDVRSGELQTITATSPLAHNSTQAQVDPRPGTVSILMPVSWSEAGDRLLARQFEGLLSTSLASDYAVIWDRAAQTTQTCAPQDTQYSNAILLGWSTAQPTDVLFRVGNLGEEPWLLWRVSGDNQTALAAGDQPIVFGQVESKAWSGAQINWA